MVHLTESESWRWAFQLILENTRWDLPDADVERHMAVAFEYVMETLGEADAAARRLDPAGAHALALSQRMRRTALQEGGREDAERLGHVARLAAALRHLAEHALRRLVRQRAALHQADELR